MDPLSIIGIILAFFAIVGGNYLEGGHLESLLNGPAIIIVGGGTLGAIFLQTPVSVFWRAVKLSKVVFMPPRIDIVGALAQLVSWSQRARKEGLLGLEKDAHAEEEAFLRKGSLLLVDGNEPEEIRLVLETELDQKERQDLAAAKVFESMGGYSPTIGIIGAVLGLIHVMQNLADPSKLGDGIATAFVATVYGVGMANLFFLPIASKIKSYVHRQVRYREMVIAGLVAIAEGENPRQLEEKLSGFVD